MNINYETYKIFYSVATNGSISKASKKLLISQPAVTWHLKNLEEQLGVTLFVRTKKGVKFTEEGKIFFEYIKRGIDNFTSGENTLTNMRNLEFGKIRIGASTTVSKYVLMKYLEIFHDKYPNIEIEIINTLTEDLISELKKGNLDILFLNMPMRDNKDLKIIKVMDVQDIFVGNKKYYDLCGKNLKLEELNNYPLLFQKHPSNTRSFLDKYAKDNNVTLYPKTEIVSYNLIMEFVKIGFGIGYATKEFVKEDLENKKLYEIKVKPKIPKRNIAITMLNQTIPNYCVNKLIDIIKENKH